MTTETPRIYVASLADYNAGRLHGAWIDADQDADAIRVEIATMLRESREPGAEEYAIHDYDGFAGLKVGEFETVDAVAELAALIAEHGPAYAAYRDHVGADYATPEGFQDAYQGQWDNEEAFGDNLYGDCCEPLPDGHPLAPYISTAIDAWSRDLFVGGDYAAVNVHDYDSTEWGIYVFDNHA